MMESFKEQFISSITSTMESSLREVSIFTEEIRTFIMSKTESQIRKSGPNSQELEKYLIRKFGLKLDSEIIVKFRSIYSSSIMTGFTKVINTFPIKKGSKKPNPKKDTRKRRGTKTEKTTDMKSMTLMEFTDVKMSSSWNNNVFPAKSVLSDDNSFCHLDKGVGQFW